MASEPTLKILVAIASYGTGNNHYLSRLVEEYRSMPFEVHIVVLSNLQKKVAPGVELFVGLPYKNPWTLPYPHKEIFAKRINDYDLFIYSEDDVLITEKNVRAFLEVSAVLADDEIAGFLRFERGDNGSVNYPDVHGHYHWEPRSLKSSGEYRFAHFTNEHSACYLLTRTQLRRAIDSGGFLVGPHETDYDLLCSAATDPYTQCGMRKLICISHLDDFLVHHLSNKYVGVTKHVGVHLGVNEQELRGEVETLLQMNGNAHRVTPLFNAVTRFKGGLYSKDCYEPPRPEILSAVPPHARSVLSVGCGSCEPEKALAAKGLSVVAVPLDSVICAGARAANVEVIEGNMQTACEKLAGRSFDCLLLPNMLHLVAEPIKVLSSFTRFLVPGSPAVVVVPNLSPMKVTRDVAKRAAGMAHEKVTAMYWKMLCGDVSLNPRGGFETTGAHRTTDKTVKEWCKSAGLTLESICHVVPPKARKASRLSFGLMDGVMASEIIAVARRN